MFMHANLVEPPPQNHARDHGHHKQGPHIGDARERLKACKQRRDCCKDISQSNRHLDQVKVEQHMCMPNKHTLPTSAGKCNCMPLC